MISDTYQVLDMNFTLEKKGKSYPGHPESSTMSHFDVNVHEQLK